LARREIAPSTTMLMPVVNAERGLARNTVAAAISSGVAIRPVVLDYGPAAQEIGWWHEPGKDNVLRLLGRPGSLPVTVHLLPPLDRAGDRKQLSQAAREAIAQRLGLTSEGHSHIGREK
jgi:1-acyl-sn-glycerol-3-phosphate acyltransferase